jgi:spore germination protein (amino acid permease)
MKKKISIYQFFVLMTILPYGSASLFFLAPEAKQDAWICLLSYSLIGILLQIIYITLYNKYPEDTLVTYMPKIYGKFIGSILGIMYIVYFTYAATRVFRDFSELISAFSLQHTSKLIFGMVFIITIIYAIYNGIENISNLVQLCFLIIIIIKIGSFFLISSMSDVVKLYNLKPILSDGILSVLKKSWRLIAFPYGETLVFTMLYPLVIENNKIKKVAILSIVTEAILLSLNNILFISTLGVNFATSTNFPLLETYRLIQISDFFSKTDIIFILLFLVGGFFKICIFLYAAVLGTSQILNLKNTRFLSIPFGIIVLISSLLIAKNYPQHIKTGLGYVINYVHIPMQIIIPIITLLVYYIKNLILNKNKI